MSLMPALELGVWNAWMLAVPGFLLPWIPPYINKDVANKRMGKLAWRAFSTPVKVALILANGVVMPFTILYSFFVPLHLGTVWFYVGLPITVAGIVVPCIAGVAFATAPLDTPITTGVYRFTRNPEYFSMFLQYIGIGISGLSWVFILCAATWILSMHIMVVHSEEPTLLAKYGEAYKAYMQRSPRWIGRPKPREQ